jgi:hypothetical protein
MKGKCAMAINDLDPTFPKAKLDAARSLLEENEFRLKAFVEGYLDDTGVATYIVGELAKDYGPAIAEDMYGHSMDNATHCDIAGDRCYSIDELIKGAVSFKFLVERAAPFSGSVIPNDVFPLNELVDAAMLLFHNRAKQAAVAKN